MHHFLYKLNAPRTTFPADITPLEADLMQRHAAYWQAQMQLGRLIAIGPVADPQGTYGIAILWLESDLLAKVLGENDPAILAQAGFSFEIHAMPRLVLAQNPPIEPDAVSPVPPQVKSSNPAASAPSNQAETGLHMNTTLQQIFVALGRILLALLFILSGISKIGGYAGTAALMMAHGIPSALLPLVIGGEIGGGVLLALGLFSRPVAALLALYSIAAIVIFHVPPHGHVEAIIVLVETAMVGGLIDLAARGGGSMGLDGLRQSRSPVALSFSLPRAVWLSGLRRHHTASRR
jgi:putative oxidoreductase